MTRAIGSQIKQGARRFAGTILTLALALVLAHPAFAQQFLGGTMSDFKSVDSDETGRRSVLSGSRAKGLGVDKVQVQDLVIRNFRQGKLDFVIEAPECIFDRTTKTASGPGTLTMRAGEDERMRIEGRGFVWDQESGRLTLSNDVTAILSKSLVLKEAEKPVAGPSALPSEALPLPDAAPTNAPVRIRSERFYYAANEASFAGSVRVLDGENVLTSTNLVARFADEDHKLRRVMATGSVRLDQPRGSATAEQAEYDVERRRVRLKGSPAWAFEGREGRSDELDIDQITGEFHALGNVFLKVPAAELAPPKLGGGTNKTEQAKFVETRADELFYRKNSADFLGDVHAVHGTTEIFCQRLELISADGSAPNEARATGGVRIVQEGNEVTSPEATYLGREATLTFVNGVKWEFTGQKGRSDSLVAYGTGERFEAVGSVRVELPVDAVNFELGPNPNPDAEPSGTNRVRQLVLVADRIDHAGKTTVFRGNVRASENEVELLRCPRLEATSGEEGGLSRVRALDGVTLQNGSQTATGHEADYDMELETVTLTGEPRLITPGRTVRAERILLDRKTQTIRILGQYHIQVSRAGAVPRMLERNQERNGR